MCLNHERAQPRGEGQCMRQVQKKERMHTSGLGPETHVFGAPMMQSSAPKSNELYPWYSSPAQACLAGTDEVGLLLHRTLKARLGPFMQLHVHGSNSGEVAGPGQVYITDPKKLVNKVRKTIQDVGAWKRMGMAHDHDRVSTRPQ
eukprot:706921-Rhodomonas_salina.1